MINLPADPANILIIKPSALGDIVHTLPFLHQIRGRFPSAKITWLVTPAFSSLLTDHPQIDEVMLFDRRRFPRFTKDPSAATAFLEFAKDLRARQFDVVFDLQGLFRSGFIAWQTRAPVRIGFANARELAPHFYTHRVPQTDPDRHAVERYLDMAEAVGCERRPAVFDFAVDDETRRSVAALLPPDRPYCVLLPGTNWATKRWPGEYFLALSKRITERLGLSCVVAGGDDVVGLVNNASNVIDLAGRTSLKQLVAVLERAALVVANDSGPMHIAAALGRPLVTLFGPTNPRRTGPYNRPSTVTRLDISCSPCYSRKCTHHSCMRGLTPETVFNTISEQLNSQST